MVKLECLKKNIFVQKKSNFPTFRAITINKYKFYKKTTFSDEMVRYGSFETKFFLPLKLPHFKLLNSKLNSRLLIKKLPKFGSKFDFL